MIPSAMEAASTSNVGTTKTDSNALRLINKRIEDLRNKHNLILQKEQKVLHSKYRVIAQIDELEKLSKEISSLQSCKEESDETDSAARVAKRRRRVADVVETKPLDKERYLCVSNGIAIFCLDLKQSKYQCFSNALDIPPLPKISTLNLLEEHRPISVGLFKLGSDAYVIGGEVPLLTARDPNPLWNENPNDSSCVTQRLSLVGGTLSLSKCNIGKLKKPKMWPIVDKIDGQIHVLDTVPFDMFDDVPDWIFTHEALTLDEGWIKVPTIRDVGNDYSFFGRRDKDYITCHLVVGDRLFAKANGGFLVFDSSTMKWGAYERFVCRDPFSVKQVCDILDLGISRCAGEFPHRDPSDLLYVLIALVFDVPDDTLSLVAVAYLVTSTGKVLCFQRLPHFFDGPVKPWGMLKGTVIEVSEEGRTMCSIVSADLSGDDNSCEYLFINTFTVKGLTDAASKVHRQIWGNASEDGPVEQEFVRVVHKDRYVFKTGGEVEDDFIRLLPVQACFL